MITAQPGLAHALVDLAVLDIAGTTVEEHGAVYTALEDAVVAAGGRPGRSDIEQWMGADKHEAVTALLRAGHDRDAAPAAATVQATYADFTARLNRAYADKPPVPMEGVPEALAALRSRGVKVALTTGFTRDVTRPILRSIGWEHGLIAAVITVDEVAAGRPAPYMIFHAMERAGVSDVARVLVAGDTVRDLQAGVNAGAGFVVGVLTGGHDATVLGAVRHTHLLPGVRDIPALVL